MRKLFHWTAAGLLLAGTSDLSYGHGAVVTVERNDYEVRQDFTRREIALQRGDRAMAFTKSNLGLELYYRLERGAEAGQIVATLHANLTGGHQQIEIPTEYTPDSCEYQVLRTHELRHVDRNVQAMAWLKDEIEKDDSSKPVREFVGKTPDEIVDILQRELDSSTTKQYLKKYDAKRQELNDPLDSESARLEEYGQCHNWQTR